jgi:hypothetical protein
MLGLLTEAYNISSIAHAPTHQRQSEDDPVAAG